MNKEQIMVLIADLRSRINPAYASQLGTESYERRLCVEAIESLVQERDALKAENKMLWDARVEPHEKIALYMSECNRLERERDAYKRGLESEMKSCDAHAKVVDALKAELEQIKAEFARVHDILKEKDNDVEFLTAELAAIKAQEPVAWLTSAGKPVVLDQASSEQAKLYGWEPLYTRSKA